MEETEPRKRGTAARTFDRESEFPRADGSKAKQPLVSDRGPHRTTPPLHPVPGIDAKVFYPLPGPYMFLKQRDVNHMLLRKRKLKLG